MIQEIENVLDKHIRPTLQKDGGNIEILYYNDEEKVLQMRLMGQCCTCPQASHTSENIIKTTLKAEFEEIKEIIVETGLSEEMLQLAKQYLRG
ncbi:Fe-S cluster biogenesis protein NfuA, 4Fe-4S-binding domain [Anaerovirgula multivorans]|uniref:Fe-S cluster biogenesis protein NfuA, 4Fe-4S-binding domain n=1 Tax=Anaerovirgula multivorans TaxID=312168 RepID=A0A239CZ15_9FIRM|nr:NifU family protein [Anaerovirgula multivorans]SNS25465.1 Fe-S cluster biogenesis protein NfuA, 4Fe-4S-binding domain [Anaerovirgula multivorans]